MKSLDLITLTLNRVLPGDKEGLFTSIWETYRKRLYYYITAVMHCSREDGEDLLQEIMMKVYNNMERYNPGYPLDGWIYAIARNHCLDFRRKTGCRPVEQEYRDCDGEAPDPYETVCRGELHRAIHGCLRGMDEIDREMVYLRHFERLRFKTIGEIIGMNVNSVKTRMRALEARLRQDLKEWL